MRQKHVILLKKEHLIFKNAFSIECPGRLLLESTSKNFIGEKEIFDKKITAKQFNEILLILDITFKTIETFQVKTL